MGGRVKNSPFILKDVDNIQKKGKQCHQQKNPLPDFGNQFAN